MSPSSVLRRGQSLPTMESPRSRAFPTCVLGRDASYVCAGATQLSNTDIILTPSPYMRSSSLTSSPSNPPDFIVKIRQQQSQLQHHHHYTPVYTKDGKLSKSNSHRSQEHLGSRQQNDHARLLHDRRSTALESSFGAIVASSPLPIISRSSSQPHSSITPSPRGRRARRILFASMTGSRSPIAHAMANNACPMNEKTRDALMKFESKVSSLTTSTSTLTAAQEALAALVKRHARSADLDAAANRKELEDIREKLIDSLMKARGRRGRKPRRLVERVRDLWPLLEEAAEHALHADHPEQSLDHPTDMGQPKQRETEDEEMEDLIAEDNDEEDMFDTDARNETASTQGYDPLLDHESAATHHASFGASAPETLLSNTQSSQPRYVSRSNSYSEEDDLFLARSLLSFPEQQSSYTCSEDNTEDANDNMTGVFDWLHDHDTHSRGNHVDLESYVAQIWRDLDLPMLETCEMNYQATMA